MNSYLNSKGWLTVPEREFLKYQAEQCSADATILNIGIEFGASLHCIRAGNSNASLQAIDIIGDFKLVGDVDAQIYRIDSSKLVDLWEMPIDFAFIDGDHSYDGVIADCKFLEHVIAGGVASFHDCYSWGKPPRTIHEICPEVNQAVSDWFKNSTGWVELEPVDSIRVFQRLE